jgi:hypothetical protein
MAVCGIFPHDGQPGRLPNVQANLQAAADPKRHRPGLPPGVGHSPSPAAAPRSCPTPADWKLAGEALVPVPGFSPPALPHPF